MCEIPFPWKDLNGIHRRTSTFTLGSEQKRQKIVGEEVREVTVMAFSAYGPPLEMVTSFIYLGGNYLGRLSRLADGGE